MTERMDRYAVHEAAQLFPPFLDTLNNWYIRRSRARVWTEDPRRAGQDGLLCNAVSRAVARDNDACAILSIRCGKRVGAARPSGERAFREVAGGASQYINESLSQQVAVARTIITAGLAIRAREKIRVRQPLSECPGRACLRQWISDGRSEQWRRN